MSPHTRRAQRPSHPCFHESRPAHPALLIALSLALGLILAMVWMVAEPRPPAAQAMPGNRLASEQDDLDSGIIRVATTGTDTEECGTEGDPCGTVQYAVDKALPGDEIRVAAGTYTGMDNLGDLRQIVYLDKSLTIRGGFTTANWTAPDPSANPTTLDAEREGRVMVISPDITVHLEGLHFVGGDATGLGGGPTTALGGEPPIKDAGGGLYILTATVTISNSTIFSNTASASPERPGCGGGLYARAGSVTLTHNTIVSNTAGSWYGFGGGIYLDHGDATLLQNDIVSNTASFWGDGYGGGLYLYGRTPPDPFPSASLLDNKLRGNYGSRTADGWGGGIQASYYRIELMDNLVQYNTAGTAKEGKGGGLYIFFSDALLEDNVIRYNIANLGMGTPEQRSDEEEDEMPEGMSGGVHFCTCGDVRLENNAIYGNIACLSGNGYGGGVSFCKTTATLDSNKIISNTATLSTTGEVKGWGGGVWTGDNASVSFSNDLIAGNHAKTQGAGLWFGVENEAYNDRGIRLQHVTISDNTGPYLGHGVYVTHAIAFLTNTIMANHSIGIYVSGVGSPEYRGAATLEATLWYANDVNATGGGTIKLGIHNYNGDPAFVDPGNWDYHIGPDSPAIDRGVQTGVRTDMDGERRPWLAPDLGADEVWPPGAAVRAYLPLILRQSSGE